jgi:hypothetical protein
MTKSTSGPNANEKRVIPSLTNSRRLQLIETKLVSHKKGIIYLHLYDMIDL